MSLREEAGALEQTETCCFTGHRPDKLPWGIRENDPRCVDLKVRLAAALELLRREDRQILLFTCQSREARLQQPVG